jgi:chromosome segregation protein
MSDVIFSGSRSRKPANAAHVELTFDNRSGFLASDEEEVTVTRVLHRSGESEYRLNGNACRLKDIRHLLLDTGLGVDAYSIIEQGRVDMLLQADPLQRREIFEEAAGISRYKVQRAEAQRKLERTQNNLLRARKRWSSRKLRAAVAQREAGAQGCAKAMAITIGSSAGHAGLVLTGRVSRAGMWSPYGPRAGGGIAGPGVAAAGGAGVAGCGRG